MDITGKGIVTLELFDTQPHEIARLHRILHAIVMNGVLEVRNSHMKLDFDKDGELTSIEALKKWRLNDPTRPLISDL